jgi:hypothetical protein
MIGVGGSSRMLYTNFELALGSVVCAKGYQDE